MQAFTPQSLMRPGRGARLAPHQNEQDIQSLHKRERGDKDKQWNQRFDHARSPAAEGSCGFRDTPAKASGAHVAASKAKAQINAMIASVRTTFRRRRASYSKKLSSCMLLAPAKLVMRQPLRACVSDLVL